MPIYRPEHEIIGSDNTKSIQIIDNDLTITTSYPTASGSGLRLYSIQLSVSGIFQNIAVIPSSVTNNITRTTLVVTIREKK